MVRMILMGIWMVSTANAQWAHSNMLAGAAGLSGYQDRFWGISAYPAAMQNHSSAIGFYGEKRYLTDLSYFELGFLGEMSRQTFHIRLIREGNPELSTTSATLAIGKKLTEQISMAFTSGYALSIVKGYGNRGRPLAGLGAILRLNSKLRWGIHADGVGSIFKKSTSGNFSVRTGIGYMVSDLALLSLEIVKETGFPVYSMAGIRYHFLDDMYAIFGYAFQLSTSSFTLGYRYRGLDLCLSATYHLYLGVSGGISVSSQLNRRQ